MYLSGRRWRPGVDPIAEDPLVGLPELAGAGEHSAAIDADGESESEPVLEREQLGTALGIPVE